MVATSRSSKTDQTTDWQDFTVQMQLRDIVAALYGEKPVLQTTMQSYLCSDLVVRYGATIRYRHLTKTYRLIFVNYISS